MLKFRPQLPKLSVGEQFPYTDVEVVVMAVKEVQRSPVSPTLEAHSVRASAHVTGLPHHFSSSQPESPTDEPAVQSLDTVEFSSMEHYDRSFRGRNVKALGEAIEATHVAVRAVATLGQFVDALHGLTEMAIQEGDSPRKVKILEDEGVEIQRAVVETASVQTNSGLKPLAGDPIRVELERTLGPMLEMILPDEATSTLGITEISFSSKEMILATATKIEVARKRLEEMRSTLADGLEHIAGLAGLQRSQGVGPTSSPPLTDIDSAQQAAWNARTALLSMPEVGPATHRPLPVPPELV